MKKYVYAIVVLALTLTLAACGGSGKGASNTASAKGSSKSYPELRWGFTIFPGALDITRNVFNQIASIEGLVVTNLMEFGPGGKVQPGLASSAEQPTPTTYVYHLRQMKFSDGKPVTAADVVFSLERNITAKEAWTKSYWEDATSISAPNSSTVVVKLKRPDAVFQDIVAFTSQVIEKASAEKIGEKELGTPGHMVIGAGPWMFTGYQPEAGVELARNPYWTGTQQPAEKITISLFKTEASEALALRSGAIEGVFDYLSPKIFADIPGVSLVKAPGTTINYMSANTEAAPLNNVHVRRALAYATDAKGMINALYPGGLATTDPTIMPANLLEAIGAKSEVNSLVGSLPKYEFDIEKAKQELALSPYPHGFSTSIGVEDTASNLVSAAQIFSSDLAKIGVTANVDEVTPAQDAELLHGKTQLLVNEVYSVYPDPEGIMSSIIAPGQIYPGSGLNSANFRNAEVDKLLPESVETLNSTKRLQLIGKILKTTNEEVPYWPIGTHATFAALSDKYVLSASTFNGWTLLWGPWALGVKLAS